MGFDLYVTDYRYSRDLQRPEPVLTRIATIIAGLWGLSRTDGTKHRVYWLGNTQRASKIMSCS